MWFYLSKFLWLLINPFNILIIFLIIGILTHILFNNLLHKVFYSITIIFFFIIAVMPTGYILFYQLEKQFHESVILPNQVDGIIILAGATIPELSKEYNQIHLGGSSERLIESIWLIKKYPQAKIIFSGGSGSIYNQKNTHAEVAKNLYQKLELDTDKIFFESKSRNTHENILFSKKIAKPKINEKWIIITSAYHMRRALRIGDKLDWQLIPYAVDYQVFKEISWKPNINFISNINAFQSASHEWIGLIYYYFMGRINKIF